MISRRSSGSSLLLLMVGRYLTVTFCQFPLDYLEMEFVEYEFRLVGYLKEHMYAWR